MSKSDGEVSGQESSTEDSRDLAPGQQVAAIGQKALAVPEIKASDIPTLPAFLTWETGCDLVRSACESYVGYAYHQLRTWSQFAHSNVFDIVLKLPKSNQQRLLLAPRIFHLLQSKFEPNEEEIAYLKQFLQMEQYLCEQISEQPSSSWTALGDFYLPAETEKHRELFAHPNTVWYSDQSYQAPVMRGIVLDAYSPVSDEPHPEHYGEITRHTPEEMEVVKQRLEQSLDHIQSVSTTASSAVGAAIQVLSLIRASTLNAGTHSFSTRSIIGNMGIINLHSELWATQRISNAIIHESIHSLIYKLQLMLSNSLYTDEEAAERIDAVSPWSGRTLKLHSVVHACFVWFGLWSFWSLNPIQDAGSEALRKRRATDSYQGLLEQD